MIEHKWLRAGSVVCLLLLGACSGVSPAGERVMIGSAVGMAAGAAATVATAGCVPCGVAIGGASGAGAGYLYHYFNRTPGR